jgi:DNA-binding YbaB/EbfC family protein
MAKIQEELESEITEAGAGGGAVKVAISGKLKVQTVEITPEATEDIEMLQDLIVAATNEAIDKAQELAQSRLSAVTGGFNIPGLM